MREEEEEEEEKVNFDGPETSYICEVNC